MVKWAGVLTAVIVTVADVTANVMVAALSQARMPDVINFLAMGATVTGVVIAFVSHLYTRINAKLDLLIELLVGRFDEVAGQIGDRNSGFVEGYLLSHAPDATVVPLSRAGIRRGAGGADE